MTEPSDQVARGELNAVFLAQSYIEGDSAKYAEHFDPLRSAELVEKLVTIDALARLAASAVELFADEAAGDVLDHLIAANRSGTRRESLVGALPSADYEQIRRDAATILGMASAGQGGPLDAAIDGALARTGAKRLLEQIAINMHLFVVVAAGRVGVDPHQFRDDVFKAIDDLMEQAEKEAGEDQ